MSKSLGAGPGWGTVQAWSTVHCRQKLSELSRAFNQLKLDKKKQEEDFAAQEMESVARLTSKVDTSMLLQLHRRPVTTECVSVSLPTEWQCHFLQSESPGITQSTSAVLDAGPAGMGAGSARQRE